jgi:predicted MFS family arabinose efflux permease
LPAWQAFVTQLAPKDELLSAITLNSGQFNASRAVGPALGGLVITYLSASAAFMINAVSFVAVIGVLLAIRSREPIPGRSEGRALREFRDGVRYTRAHTSLVVAVAVVASVAFFGSPVLSLAAVLARRALQIHGAAYGLLVAAFGVGGVLGAILLSGYGDAFRRSRILTAAVALYGLGLLSVGLSPVYGVALAGMLVLGVAYLACVSAANTSIQLLVVEQFRGRVLAIYTMAITGGIPLGALVQGWLADQIGVRETLSGGAVVLLGVATFLLLQPRLRGSLDSRPREGSVNPTGSLP